MTLKTRLHFRLANLSKPLSGFPFCADIGEVVALKGTVIKSSLPRMLEFAKTFSCAKCGHSFTEQADYHQSYKFDPPSVCPGDDSCPSTYFKAVDGVVNSEFCRDYQEIKIQEQLELLAAGAVPKSIWATLEDDLVDSCKPGDDVLLVGTVTRRWQTLGKSAEGRTEISLVIKVRVSEKRMIRQLRYNFTNFFFCVC